MANRKCGQCRKCYVSVNGVSRCKMDKKSRSKGNMCKYPADFEPRKGRQGIDKIKDKAEKLRMNKEARYALENPGKPNPFAPKADIEPVEPARITPDHPSGLPVKHIKPEGETTVPVPVHEELQGKVFGESGVEPDKEPDAAPEEKGTTPERPSTPRTAKKKAVKPAKKKATVKASKKKNRKKRK